MRYQNLIFVSILMEKGVKLQSESRLGKTLNSSTAKYSAMKVNA